MWGETNSTLRCLIACSNRFWEGSRPDFALKSLRSSIIGRKRTCMTPVEVSGPLLTRSNAAKTAAYRTEAWASEGGARGTLPPGF